MPNVWYPLSTAPKDGTTIRLLIDTPGWHSQTMSAWWNPEGDSWADDQGKACQAGEGTIQVIGCWACEGGWLQENEATSWQPIWEEHFHESTS